MLFDFPGEFPNNRVLDCSCTAFWMPGSLFQIQSPRLEMQERITTTSWRQLLERLRQRSSYNPIPTPQKRRSHSMSRTGQSLTGGTWQTETRKRFCSRPMLSGHAISSGSKMSQEQHSRRRFDLVGSGMSSPRYWRVRRFLNRLSLI